MMHSMCAEAAPLDWRSYLAALESLHAWADRSTLAHDPQLRQEAVQQLAMTVAQGYFVLFSQRPEAPQLVSFTNPIVNSATNPDFMYYYAAIDAHRAYRLSGTRGSSRFIHVVQNSGMIGLDEVPGPPLAMLDIDSLEISAQGSFSVMLSAERVDAGDWWHLNPRASSISIRQAACDWDVEADGRLALECLDPLPPTPRLEAREIAARLRDVGRFADRYLAALDALLGILRARPVNTLHLNDWRQFGGLANQYYYQGHFEIAPGDALVIESEIPRQTRYWGIVTLDELFNSLDWVNNQTSLNDSQAQLDSDGRFRAVLSLEDPKVPNWLDPVGRRRGLLQGRWFEASSGPLPTVTKVPLAALREFLPSDTPAVSGAQRRELLQRRSRGAQYRRKW
jgi:hypothetical protein